LERLGEAHTYRPSVSASGHRPTAFFQLWQHHFPATRHSPHATRHSPIPGSGSPPRPDFLIDTLAAGREIFLATEAILGNATGARSARRPPFIANSTMDVPNDAEDGVAGEQLQGFMGTVTALLHSHFIQPACQRMNSVERRRAKPSRCSCQGNATASLSCLARVGCAGTRTLNPLGPPGSPDLVWIFAKTVLARVPSAGFWPR
jgi:hypothetical protein